MDRWQGKVAVVTGASSGIGLATAKQLVQNGLIVIGLARRVDQMKEGMKDVKGQGKFHAKECDITSEKSVIEVFNWIRNTFKSLHILINNAGTNCVSKIEDAPTEDLETTFKVNVFGLLYCTKQAIKLMKENETEAHIINVNSVLGHKVLAFPNFSLNVYPASKFAVTALSETLTNELRDSKIRVTNISPGAVKTELMDRCREQIAKTTSGNSIPGPALESEDVSSSILYTLSVPPHVQINEITLQAK